MHALKAGQKLVKKTGAPGPVRTVKKVEPRGGTMMCRLEWEGHTRRDGLVTCLKWVGIDVDGLPAGYVLAKDRKAVRK